MDIRILFGPRKDQIVDVENEAALAMLKDGRAENPYLDKPVTETFALAEAEKPARKRR